MAKRVMGKASFAHVQDRSGQIQMFVQRDVVSADVYKAFKGWDLGDIVWARGSLFQTRTGELTVKVVGDSTADQVPATAAGEISWPDRCRRRGIGNAIWI